MDQSDLVAHGCQSCLIYARQDIPVLKHLTSAAILSDVRGLLDVLQTLPLPTNTG